MGYTRKVHNVESRMRAMIADSQSPIMHVGDTPTAAGTAFATRAYARYVGRRSKLVTEVRVQLFLSGANAAGAGYAELAVATGAVEDIPNITGTDLTVPTNGWVSIDTEAKAAGLGVVQKTLTGLTIPANTDIWVVFASSYATTQVGFRTAETVMELRAVDGFRPSLSLDTPSTFGGWTSAVVICPWMKVFIP